MTRVVHPDLELRDILLALPPVLPFLINIRVGRLIIRSIFASEIKCLTFFRAAITMFFMGVLVLGILCYPLFCYFQ